MDSLKMPAAHLVGNSFGCQVIAEFAVRHPDRVRCLVLQAPTVDASARTFSQQLRRLIQNSGRSRALGWMSLQDYYLAGIPRARASIHIALTDRIEDKLPHIQAPTLVVRGSNDPVVPQAWAERVTLLLPHGRLCVIPGVRHTINFSHPRHLVRVMRPFLGI